MWKVDHLNFTILSFLDLAGFLGASVGGNGIDIANDEKSADLSSDANANTVSVRNKQGAGLAATSHRKWSIRPSSYSLILPDKQPVDKWVRKTHRLTSHRIVNNELSDEVIGDEVLLLIDTGSLVTVTDRNRSAGRRGAMCRPETRAHESSKLISLPNPLVNFGGDWLLVKQRVWSVCEAVRRFICACLGCWSPALKVSFQGEAIAQSLTSG
ncbi:hypothetical protein CDV36_000827 [Fusarium kuroshium]|uniref:Peptidase A2 domain-containing protein n=1 Tax=Fusarium kuroshium TaxID=2010991 RepID=A0A3M2SPS0_9HYPO|nr:hypothetical protein CDV36_000827 [Fusarium kuroshium]